MAEYTAEPWRPVSAEDALNHSTMPHMEEGFVRTLDDGVRLWYLRTREAYPIEGMSPILSDDVLSYFAKQPSDNERPLLMAKMAGGRIAVHGAIDMHLANVAYIRQQGKIGEYLAEIAELMGDVLPHFEGVPTSNPNYQEEMDLLALVVEGEEIFREGPATDGDMDLFWRLKEAS